MKKLIPFFLLVILFYSCKKENDNIIWERSLGQGNAFFIEATQDSGMLSCGTLAGKPYLVKFNMAKSIETDFTSDREGLFSSAWSDTSGFIAAGSSKGKMVLARIDKNGYKVWDTTIIASFYLDITSILDEGNGKFLAVGSASPDSAAIIETNILFVRFDTAGQISKNWESSESGFVSANNASADMSGNIYLPLTRKFGTKKPKASIAKYNKDLYKLWETELYNNPDFTAVSYDAFADGTGNVYVTGRMEATNMSGTLNNSFLASLSRTGEVKWKKYIENSNSGSSVIADDSEGLIMLNRNCFIIRKVNANDGSDDGIIRMYSQCDSYTTDAFGSDMNISYDGNFLAAGSLGGNFYIALKSSQ
ncbi:MAG: hypothetical protein NT092_00485 [Bacteroidia bacterium]|nr:hypothetical protein [Bacteroidia bacterium]